MTNQLVTKLNLEIIGLMEKHAQSTGLPAYEIGFAMIHIAVSMLYEVAPTDAVAHKTIMAAIEHGVENYEEIRQ